jgi:rapamycin-insensitive companion of mTOR
LEAFNNQLAVENRIKEGAENLLNMQLTVSTESSFLASLPFITSRNFKDTLRLQVESELDMASSKIEAIMKRIELREHDPSDPSPSKLKRSFHKQCLVERRK